MLKPLRGCNAVNKRQGRMRAHHSCTAWGWERGCGCARSRLAHSRRSSGATLQRGMHALRQQTCRQLDVSSTNLGRHEQVQE
jgi:hypothetical protein